MPSRLIFWLLNFVLWGSINFFISKKSSQHVKFGRYYHEVLGYCDIVVPLDECRVGGLLWCISVCCDEFNVGYLNNYS